MKAKIKLAFRIQINVNSTNKWDKCVFESTFLEYKIQHQIWNDAKKPVKAYWELLQINTNAQKIPFMLNAAVFNYVSLLNGEIRSLPDVLGNTFFPIDSFNTDIISAHVEDVFQFKIGITFYTPELKLIDIIDNKYLLSKDTDENTDGLDTFMFAFHPQVAISFYKTL